MKDTKGNEKARTFPSGKTNPVKTPGGAGKIPKVCLIKLRAAAS